MRVIVRCAGPGDRWDNYRGVPKHLAPICGEPVLHRTVRLITDIDPDADTKIVVPDLSDRRYLVPGSSRSTDKPTPEDGDIDKIASSAHLWARTGRTVTLWGDTWWSRPALTDVLTAEVDDWHAWLRIGPDGAGGELFAFVWQAHMNDTVREACDRIAQAHRAGELDGAGYDGGEIRGGWALYRALCGVPLDALGDHGNAAIVDDWTDDMDQPDDWDRWCYRWAKARPADRPELA